MLTNNNNISAKEYNKISKYKNLETENEKMQHLKITILPVIMGVLVMIKIAGSHNLTEIKKLHFVELVISLGEYYQSEWKISPKRGCKKHKYIEYN